MSQTCTVFVFKQMGKNKNKKVFFTLLHSSVYTVHLVLFEKMTKKSSPRLSSAFQINDKINNNKKNCSHPLSIGFKIN